MNHPLLQLFLARLREFYREPEVIFWVYGFPLILAVGLGIAFSGGKPEPPTVDVGGSESDPRVQKVVDVLKGAKMKVEVHSPEECLARVLKGKTAIYVTPQDNGELKYYYDET